MPLTTPLGVGRSSALIHSLCRMSELETFVPQGLSTFNSWLSKNNAGPWSITALTDAQKESLLWIGVSFIFILAFWRGTPYAWHWPYVGYQDKEGVWDIKPIILLKWIPLLVPFKYLTVLFHEVRDPVGTLLTIRSATRS